MKIDNFINDYLPSLGLDVEVIKYPSLRRWSIGGFGQSYFDPYRIKIKNFEKLGQPLGEIRGPESSTIEKFYKVKGFYLSQSMYVPENFDVFTSSKLRNSRYKVLNG